jgi:hypothetical protein
MSYTNNDDKPDALLISYATIRGAELKEIYRVLDSQGEVPETALERRFARPESDSGGRHTDHIENCLKLLRAVDVVSVSAQGVVQLLNDDIYPELGFEGKLLHHIRQQDGKQAHLSYVFDVLAREDCRRIGRTQLLTALKDDDTRTFGLQWNETKLNMWGNLGETIGALSYVDNSTVVASPTRALLYDLLSWYSEHGDDASNFLEATNWIHDEILPVYASQPGTPQLSVGVADVLRNMEDDGVLSLRSMSDAQHVVDVPRRTGETEPVVEFTVDERAQPVPYTYPLDRDITEGVA